MKSIQRGDSHVKKSEFTTIIEESDRLLEQLFLDFALDIFIQGVPEKICTEKTAASLPFAQFWQFFQ